VLYNTTTIESLDQSVWHDNKFKMTNYENWVQVFGENKLLWFLPIHFEEGRPVGDGLVWKTNSKTIAQDDFSTAYKKTDPLSVNTHKHLNSNNVSEFSQNNIKSIRDKAELVKVMNPFLLTPEDLSSKTRVNVKSDNNYKSNDSTKQFSVNGYASTKDAALLFSPTSVNTHNHGNDFNIERILSNNLKVSSVKKDTNVFD